MVYRAGFERAGPGWALAALGTGLVAANLAVELSGRAGGPLLARRREPAGEAEKQVPEPAAATRS